MSDSDRKLREVAEHRARVCRIVEKADRRERIATACLAGLIASDETSSWKTLAIASVKAADALIEELDK